MATLGISGCPERELEKVNRSFPARSIALHRVACGQGKSEEEHLEEKGKILGHPNP